MRVVILSPGADTGGQGGRIKRAFDRHAPDWQVTSIAASDNYCGFPGDKRWDYRLVEKLVAEADVIHTKTTIRPYRQFDRGRNKPVLLHHHGTAFRDQPRIALEEADFFGAVTAVSTHDLMLFRDDIRWLPSPQDVDYLRTLRATLFEPSKAIRILHAPTNRRVKDTDLFMQAAERLAETHNVRVRVLEGRPWKEVLREKARWADIFYDQVRLGYGQNALEAWGMSIPVLAGASEPTLEKMRQIVGTLPFMLTTAETIYANLKALVEDAELRAQYGAIGYDYVLRYHDFPVVVGRLQSLYTDAMDIKRTGRTYVRIPVPKGSVERVAPGQWRRCVRDGVWASVGEGEARILEADYQLGEPVVTGVKVADAL